MIALWKLAQQNFLPLYPVAGNEQTAEVIPPQSRMVMRDSLQLIESDVFLPLLQSTTVEDLMARHEAVFPIYLSHSRAVVHLFRMNLYKQPERLHELMHQAFKDTLAPIEEKAQNKLTDVGYLALRATVERARLLVDMIGTKLVRDQDFIPDVPVDFWSQTELLSTNAGLFLNCLFYYLDNEIISADPSVLEQMAISAWQSTRGWFALFAERGFIGDAEECLPEIARLESELEFHIQVNSEARQYYGSLAEEEKEDELAFAQFSAEAASRLWGEEEKE